MESKKTRKTDRIPSAEEESKLAAATAQEGAERRLDDATSVGSSSSSTEGTGAGADGDDDEGPELVLSLSDNFIALLDRLLFKLGKIFSGRRPAIETVLQKLRKKVYILSEDAPGEVVTKTRAYRKAIVEAWDTQTKVHYETFARADADSPEMTDIISKMSADNYFLKAIDLPSIWAEEGFAPSRKVLCKNLRIMNVLACLLDLFSGEIEKVLIEIGSKFTEIFEGGGTMTSDDLQKFVHHLGQNLNMDNMIKLQKVVKKVIVMLGGVDAFESMMEKVLGKNQLLSKIIKALLMSEKPSSKEGQQSSQSILSSLNSKYGSMAGVTVEEDEGADDDTDDDDDDDEAAGAGAGAGGGTEEEDDVGCSKTSIHVTRADMQRTFETMKEELHKHTDAVSKVMEAEQAMSMAERAYNGDDGAYSSIVAAAAVAASEHGLVLDRNEFEKLAREGVAEAKEATATPSN